MTAVVVQIGQCGNQIGKQFWSYVLNDETSTISRTLLTRDEKLRSINVDSEPKVVRRLIKATKKKYFRDSNVVLGKQGRGSNWALGYHGPRGQNHLLQDSMEAVRKEVERCDCFSGFIMMHSLSGGTGSGLGAHFCEALRDEYPLHYILSSVVSAHAGGESPLQHYNSLLCLAWLARNSDGIILFDNDKVLHKLLKSAKKDSGISIPEMNDYIASCMAGLLLPVDSLMTKSGMSIGMEPWELIRSVCPMPPLKFIHTTQAIRSKPQWENITSSAMHSLTRYDCDGKLYSSVANLLVARGDVNGSFSSHVKKIEDKVKTVYNSVSWNPFPVDIWTDQSDFTGIKNSASVTIASNYSNILNTANNVLHHAKQMYDAGAYLHWYWKHGCSQDDFEEAFCAVEDIVTSYKEAVI